MTKEKFRDVSTKCCSKETSFVPEYWNKNNPTLGHCAVIALIAQDIFGGELLRASLKETKFAYEKTHYWNLLPDTSEVDFTEEQFMGKKPKLMGEIRTREHILSNKQTKQRYQLFKTVFLLKLKETLDS
jgi:hypothetical protein